MSSVCKFYLQGRCKFGNQCRYLHVKNNNSGFSSPAFPVSNSSAFSTHNRFNSLPQASTSGDRSTMNANEIIETIGKEMQEWEKSHMWPFSCYAFMKEAPCLKGLEDYSPEELRFEAYNAKKSNKITEFQNNFGQLVQSFQEKRQQLKQPTMQMRQSLTMEIDSFKQTQASKQGSTFGASSSAFSSNKPATAFGSSGGFGASNQTFGSQKQSSVFGQTTSNNPFQQKTTSAFTSSPAFGSKPAPTFSNTTQSFGSSGFGNTSQTFGQSPGFSNTFTTQSNTFGSTSFNSNQSNTPTFGSTSAFGQTTNASAFGQTTNAGGFGLTANTSAFGQTTNSSAFGQATKSSAFGTTATPSFGSSAFNTSSTFGQKPQSAFGSSFSQSNSTFGQTTTAASTSFNTKTTAAQSPFGGGTSSVFGGQPTAAVNPFGGVPNLTQQPALSEPSLVEDGCYSAVDSLTPSQLEAFKADKFDLNNIPTVPPPKELCIA